jgi:hypothetical protein
LTLASTLVNLDFVEGKRRQTQDRRPALVTITRLHRPAIRLRTAVPIFDPPFDDEVASEVWLRGAGVEQLPLDFGAPSAAASPPVAGPAPGAGSAVPAAPVAGPTPARPSPEARQAAHRFAATCVEILNGFRPAGHVRSLARPHRAELLITQLVDASGRLPTPPRRSDRSVDLLKIRVIRVSTPAPEVIEAAATLGTSARSWALAFRMERLPDSDAWHGTTLHVL